MGDFTTQTESAVDIEQPIFQPFPSQVFFEEYQAQQSYTAHLTLRNNDKVLLPHHPPVRHSKLAACSRLYI
jgi:hydrocephalus-inducing protein